MLKPANTMRLYDLCLDLVYKNLLRFCQQLKTDKSYNLQVVHDYLMDNITMALIDDILKLFYKQHDSCGDSMTAYYFFKIIMHPHIESFTAKNAKYNLSHWKCLFSCGPFTNLRVLNLTMSCDDHLLDIIPETFPNLECLNATSQIKPFRLGGNAPIFMRSVTDQGLLSLTRCKHLRELTLDDARSSFTEYGGHVTYTGVQQLLRHIPTLEDVQYSDLGEVLRHPGMDDVAKLNLRHLSHYNANEQSLEEIFRLCAVLEKLVLIFFNTDDRSKIIDKLIHNRPSTLKFLEIQKLNAGTRFGELFHAIGANLTGLTLVEPLTFEHLRSIALACPNLLRLGLDRLSNTNECVSSVENIGQFAKLKHLAIEGTDMDVEATMRFCTENAKNLEVFKIAERKSRYDADLLFSNCILAHGIEHIDTSKHLIFTVNGIRRLVKMYPFLRELSAHCPEDKSKARLAKELLAAGVVFRPKPGESVGFATHIAMFEIHE